MLPGQTEFGPDHPLHRHQQRILLEQQRKLSPLLLEEIVQMLFNPSLEISAQQLHHRRGSRYSHLKLNPDQMPYFMELTMMRISTLHSMVLRHLAQMNTYLLCRCIR